MQAGVESKIQIREMQASDFEVLEKLVHAAYRGGEAAVAWKNEHDIVSGARITQAGLKELLESNEALVLVAERSTKALPNALLNAAPNLASNVALNVAPSVAPGVASEAALSAVPAFTAIASGSELCGCVLIEKEIGQARGITVVIGMLAVSPSAQNLGLGRKLVAAAEAASRQHFSAVFAHMHVASVRGELLEWYRRLGYVLTGETKPFPGPEVGIHPLLENLQFAVIEKKL